MAKAVAQQEDGPLYSVLLVELNDLVHLYKAGFILFCLLGGFCLFVWMKQISLGLLYQAPPKIVSEFLISFSLDVASKTGISFLFSLQVVSFSPCDAKNKFPIYPIPLITLITLITFFDRMLGFNI